MTFYRLPRLILRPLFRLALLPCLSLAVPGYGSSISGKIYLDVADTGTFASGIDTPLADVVVNLYRDVDEDLRFEPGGDDMFPVASAITGIDGRYEFRDISDGSYWIAEELPPYHRHTSALFLSAILVGGLDLADQDFGNTVPGSIHGFAYQDVDGDAVYNQIIDAPLLGVEFSLVGRNGEGFWVSQVSTTDINGEYTFENLNPSVQGAGLGTGYTVTQTVSAGFTPMTPITYTSDLYSGEARVALAGQSMISSGEPRIEVTLGDVLMFGSTVPGSINGFTFLDRNVNGAYDPSHDPFESGFADMEITLTGTDGRGNEVNRVETADGSGSIRFSGLMPSVAGAGAGTGYTLTLTVPPGFRPTTPASTSLDLLSRHNLVAIPGQTVFSPGDPGFEVEVGNALMFGFFLPPSFTSIRMANNELLLEISCPLGGTYGLEDSSTVVTGWGPLTNVTCSGDSTLINLGPVDPLETSRAYRAVK